LTRLSKFLLPKHYKTLSGATNFKYLLGELANFRLWQGLALEESRNLLIDDSDIIEVVLIRHYSFQIII